MCRVAGEIDCHVCKSSTQLSSSKTHHRLCLWTPLGLRLQTPVIPPHGQFLDSSLNTVKFSKIVRRPFASTSPDLICFLHSIVIHSRRWANCNKCRKCVGRRVCVCACSSLLRSRGRHADGNPTGLNHVELSVQPCQLVEFARLCAAALSQCPQSN